MKKQDIVDEIITFLDENTDEFLIDLVKEDLNIKIDSELSSLYDEVTEKN